MLVRQETPKMLKRASRAKRARLAAAKSTRSGKSFNSTTDYTLEKLQGAELRSFLRSLSKKEVVLLAGYSNIKQLVKDNDQRITDMPTSTNGKNLQKYYSKNNIIHQMV